MSEAFSQERAAFLNRMLRDAVHQAEYDERMRWHRLDHSKAPIEISHYVNYLSLHDPVASTQIGIKGYLYSGVDHRGALTCYGNAAKIGSCVADLLTTCEDHTKDLTRDVVKALLRIADKIQRHGLDPRTMRCKRSYRRKLP